MAPLMCHACICTYTACDFEDVACLCKGKSQLCCLVSESCLAVNEECLGCGCVTNEDNQECCKIGCGICTFGLKAPDTLGKQYSHCLCFKDVCACPFDEEFLNECVCAYCCLTCAPKCGCCVEAPDCPAAQKPLKEYGAAPENSKMEDRG